MWLSLVELLIWDQEVAGSNPVIPISNKQIKSLPAFLRGLNLCKEELYGILD